MKHIQIEICFLSKSPIFMMMLVLIVEPFAQDEREPFSRYANSHLDPSLAQKLNITVYKGKMTRLSIFVRQQLIIECDELNRKGIITND
jgi:hypothetical protein